MPRLDPDIHCISSPCSENAFPPLNFRTTWIRIGTDQIVAVIPAAAFDVPGGLNVRIDLLYRLENEFRDWSELFVPAKGRGTKRAFVFTITNLHSTAQVAKAKRLFWEAVGALICLPASPTTTLRRGSSSPIRPPTTNKRSTCYESD